LTRRQSAQLDPSQSGKDVDAYTACTVAPSLIRRDRKVETLVKQLAVFLSGVATTVTGVFIRSCESGMEMDLASASCSKASPGAALFDAHAHCAGCVIAVAGAVVMGLAIASLLITRSVMNAGTMVRQ
jgi:hypothetical protein